MADHGDLIDVDALAGVAEPTTSRVTRRSPWSGWGRPRASATPCSTCAGVTVTWCCGARPPAKITASAGDTMRERRLLAALADTDVRHPRLVAACDDTSVIGVPFILMERVDGFTPIDPLPAPFDDDPSARHGLGTEVVDALAELALVDWQAVGLKGSASRTGSSPGRSTAGCGSSTAIAAATSPSSTP